MNPLKKNVFVLLSLFCWLPLMSQNVISNYQFSFDSNLSPWIPNENARFSDDGTATSQYSNWISGDRIASSSLGGAAVLWGEEAMSFGSLTSDFLDFTGEPNVFLSFHQYYRNVDAQASVTITEDGVPLAVFLVNTLLNADVRTANYDTVVIDISAAIAAASNPTNIQVEFRVQDQASYWLIDDITFYDGFPYPHTVPDTLGNYLANQGYPFEVETTMNGAGAYVPYQLVVQFKPNVTPDQREALRDSLGAVKKDSCVCNKLELWEIDGSAYFDPTGQNPAGGTTDILSNKIGAGSTGKIDGVDLNYYNGVLLQPMPTLLPADTLTADSIAGLQVSNPSDIKIAILDTGIDYYHPDLRSFIGLSDDLGDDNDDDGDCYDDNPIGWNFVDRNNNPFDDNSHGTHVAGIIADSLLVHGVTANDYEFISYKTHDYNGVSTLFAVACATYMSIEDEVNLINDSWGFFGDSSVVLRNAIDSAALEDILIVSAAGNDNIWLDTLRQYPACYSVDNVLTVGATTLIDGPNGEIVPGRAFFSNFDSVYVDIMAPGINIRSTVPDGGRDVKSGTSMATPMVTAAAARAFHLAGEVLGNTVIYENARDCVLSWASQESSLETAAQSGRWLAYGDLCVNAVDSPRMSVGNFRVYPNPMYGVIQLETADNRSGSRIRLFHSSGQLIYEQQQARWWANEAIELNFPDLAAGIYILQVEGADYLWAGKIIKM